VEGFAISCLIAYLKILIFPLLRHLRFGHKILEVSTFRTGEMSEDLITHDNVWGTEQEDVLRRDFTINGLFYDPETHSVIDYVGGWQDLQKGVLHTIGDPEVRFKQDPVRMIRLLKFQARFDFNVSDEVKVGLNNCLDEITKSSPARVLEEMLRMLESCASARFFELMLESGLMQKLFPSLADAFLGKQGPTMLRYLEAVDAVNKQAVKFPIERPILAAALVFPLIEEEIHTRFTKPGRTPHLGEILNSTSVVIRDVILASFYHFPRRIAAIMTYILSTQYRLTPIKAKKQHPARLFRIREFPMALRLLKLRAMINPELQDTYINWREGFRHFLRQEDMHTHRHRSSHERKSYEEMEAKRDRPN
jgi:poly(A) polymerase